MLKNWIWGVSFFSAIDLIACGGDSTLKWSFGGPQHVRSYTAWPNRAKGPFSQRFRSFDPKVRSGPTEPNQV